MSYRLVIVESPAKTGSFEKALGVGYKCMASYGHIRELKKLTDIDRENYYKPTYVNSSSKYKQINKLKDAMKKSNGVILATDDDKEGEAIAWHLCQVLKLPVSTTPRLIFHEVTKNAIQAAIKSPSVINMNKVHAAQARQVLDMLVGFQISPLLWKQFGGKLALSAGRCQTPALRLVYENQKDIDKSPGKIAYTTTGYFTPKALPFVLNYQHTTEDEMAGFLEEVVDSEHKHILTIEKMTNGTKNPPKPFTTSSMQQAANNELRISPKEAMSICQKLYENGLITYMRTDSRTYSKDFINSAKSYITHKYGASFIRKDIDSLSLRQNDSTKAKQDNGKPDNAKTKKKSTEGKSGGSAQEAHEAIRPTNITLKISDLDSGKLSPKERKMYSMIWRNTIESCMKPCLTIGIVANITAPNDLFYRLSEEEITDPGWKIVNGFDKENINYRYLLSKKDVCPLNVDYSKISSRLGIKDTKSHYTEAKLVQLLEDRGIGRPSTFSSLVDKIQDRGYVKKGDVEGKPYKGSEFELVGEELTETIVEKQFGGERNKLVLQPLGAMVWEYISSIESNLFDYEYTKNMETELDDIEHGNKKWYELCKECDNEVHEYTCKAKTKAKDEANDEANDDDTANAKAKTKTKTKAKSAAQATGADIKIDDNYTYSVTKYGPVVFSVVDGKKVYKSAKKNLDLESMRNGTLNVDDIIDESKTNGKNIGYYEDCEIVLKTGKYGMFVQWKEKNVSVKSLGKNAKAITLEKVIPLLKASCEEKRFREINKEMSVRVGKSPYVFYKTQGMKKPKFLHLKGFDEDPFTCDENILISWLEIKHKLDIN